MIFAKTRIASCLFFVELWFWDLVISWIMLTTMLVGDYRSRETASVVVVMLVSTHRASERVWRLVVSRTHCKGFRISCCWINLHWRSSSPYASIWPRILMQLIVYRTLFWWSKLITNYSIFWLLKNLTASYSSNLVEQKQRIFKKSSCKCWLLEVLGF